MPTAPSPGRTSVVFQPLDGNAPNSKLCCTNFLKIRFTFRWRRD